MSEIINLKDYMKKNDFLYINDEYCVADIQSIFNFLEVENNSIIPRYMNGTKKIDINYNLKSEIEDFFYEKESCREKIEQTNFNDLDFIMIQEKLKEWLGNNILSFIKDENVKIDISNSVLEKYPYSISMWVYIGT